MRLIIQPNYDLLSQWAANYVVSKIKAANPTAEKTFCVRIAYWFFAYGYV